MLEYIPSVSFGKDSTAMLLMMIERNESIHSVLWFNTEREFPEIKTHAAKVVEDTGVKLQIVRHWAGFDFLEDRYGKAHASGGWCAAAKRDCCNKYIRLIRKDNPDIVECIGYSSDEQKRADKMSKKWPVRFPLIEWGITEKMALEYCYDHGYFFDGIYDWMPSKRVSCYDCPKQSKKDWVEIAVRHPELFPYNQTMERMPKAAPLIKALCAYFGSIPIIWERSYWLMDGVIITKISTLHSSSILLGMGAYAHNQSP